MRRKINLLLIVFALGCLAWIFACAPQQTKVSTSGQYDEARRAAKSYHGPIHSAAKQLYDQGLAAYKAGRYAEAADLLGQAADVGVTNFPMRDDARVYQAYSLLKIRQHYEAFKVAEQAVHEYPQRWELRLIMIEFWLWRDRLDDAQRELSLALNVAPDEPEVVRMAVRILHYRGDLLTACEMARHLLILKPDNKTYRSLAAEVYVDYGLLVEREGDREAALTAYFAAASLDPNDPTPSLLIGRVLLAMNLVDASRRYTQAGRAKIKNPDDLRRDVFSLENYSDQVDADEHLRMADFYFGRDQAEMAAQELELALIADFRQLDVWKRLGLLHAQYLGDVLRARQCLHALWVLDAQGEAAAELQAALKLETQPPLPPSPGFIERTEEGLAFSPEQRKVTQSGPATAGLQRVYLTFVVNKAAGEHSIRLRVENPAGQPVVDERFVMEFFGNEIAIVRTGVWTTPGQYRVQWWMDDMERAKKNFVVQ